MRRVLRWGIRVSPKGGKGGFSLQIRELAGVLRTVGGMLAQRWTRCGRHLRKLKSDPRWPLVYPSPFRGVNRFVSA
jgi:hypothetical protein